MPAFRAATKLRLKYQGTSFDFYIDRQLDFDILRDTFILEEYKVKTAAPPRIIFDVGSNIGATVAYFAIKYPDARIFAFEADPETAKRFVMNARQFGERVPFFPKAVYSKDESEVSFYSLDIHWASSLIQRPGSREVAVPTITLGRVIQDYKLDSIDLVKFDIEGGEYEAFVNFHMLDSVKLLIGEIHPDVLPVSVDEFLALFKNFDIVNRVDHDNIVVTLQHKP